MGKKFTIISLFPSYFTSPLATSLLGRAIQTGIIEVDFVDIRNFSKSKHKSVDDRPYGGGPGMVLEPGPVTDAIRSCKGENSHVVYLSPQGKRFDYRCAQSFGKDERHIILLCGHYEGIDQRVIDAEVDEEISLGDFVLTSGMPAALCIIDASARFAEGVIGDERAPWDDTFHVKTGFDAPVYTRPEEFEGKKVPRVLLSGHDAKIKEWREAAGQEKCRKNRPDLCVRGEV